MAENVRPSGKPAVMIALASGRSVADAARDGGVSERTISRWKQDLEFRAEITHIRGTLLDETLGQLVAASADAVATLRSVLGSDESDAVKVRAARAILASMITVREAVDVEERLTRVEEAIAKRDAGL